MAEWCSITMSRERTNYEARRPMRRHIIIEATAQVYTGEGVIVPASSPPFLAYSFLACSGEEYRAWNLPFNDLLAVDSGPGWRGPIDLDRVQRVELQFDETRRADAADRTHPPVPLARSELRQGYQSNSQHSRRLLMMNIATSLRSARCRSKPKSLLDT